MRSLKLLFVALAALPLAWKPMVMAKDSAETVIVADLPIVASIVRTLTGPEASVVTILTGNQSPHHFQLSPSTMRSLQKTDLTVVIGEVLTPELSDITRFAKDDSELLVLSDLPDMKRLPHRSWRDENKETKTDDDHDHGHNHGHALFDPHLWLDTDNVKVIVNAIADSLIANDESQAEAVNTRRQQSLANIDSYYQQQREQWSDLSVRHVSLHDSTQYFEAQFDLPSAASLFGDSHNAPSAKALARFRSNITDNDIQCLVTDPLTNPRWIAAATEGLDLTVINVNVLGEPDSDYLLTLKNVSDAFAECGVEQTR